MTFIVVHSKSALHHVTGFRGFLARLLVPQEQFEVLAPKKAHIGAPEVQTVGDVETPFGVSPNPQKKLDAMLRMPMASTKGELCSLLSK